MTNYTNELLNQMREAGFPYSSSNKQSPQIDGQRHYYHVEGDKPGTLKGCYCVYPNEAHYPGWVSSFKGSFDDNKKSFALNKESGKNEMVTYQNKAKGFTPRKQNVQTQDTKPWTNFEDLLKDPEGENKIKILSIKSARHVWEDAFQEDDMVLQHKYMVDKKVQNYGLRFSPHWKKSDQECLLVPLLDENNEIVSLQALFGYKRDNGTNKDFWKLGVKKGSHFMIGEPTDRIYVAEGYATGATIYEATGVATAIAFDCGNMTPVGKKLQKMYPNAEIIFCADNDQSEIGLKNAKTAALAVGGRVTLCPLFDKDFNDMFIEEGLSSVQAHFENEALLINPLTKPQQRAEERKDDFSTQGYVHFNEKGYPLITKENIQVLMARNNIKAQFNTMTRNMEVVSTNVENYFKECIYTRKNKAVKTQMAGWKLDDLLLIEDFKGARKARREMCREIAHQNSYHPVNDWISRQEWDGVSRFNQLFETLKFKEGTTVEEKDFYAKLLKIFCLQYMEALKSPSGVMNEGILILQGPQGIGKSRWIQSLLDKDLEAVLTGHVLDLKDKDNKLACVTSSIVELAEFDATIAESGVSKLKAFLTNPIHKIRSPYAESAEIIENRTVYIGTVNNAEFLFDTTGNRRYFVIPIEDIDSNHEIDMQQFWAEMLYIYDRDGRMFLNAADRLELNRQNLSYVILDPVLQKMMDTFPLDEKNSNRYVRLTATQIAERCQFNDFNKKVTRSVTRSIADFITSNFPHIIKKRSGRNGETEYYVPAPYNTISTDKVYLKQVE